MATQIGQLFLSTETKKINNKSPTLSSAPKVDLRPPYRILFAQTGHRRVPRSFQWLLGFPKVAKPRSPGDSNALRTGAQKSNFLSEEL
jgi:hypothetical protein